MFLSRGACALLRLSASARTAASSGRFFATTPRPPGLPHLRALPQSGEKKPGSDVSEVKNPQNSTSGAQADSEKVKPAPLDPEVYGCCAGEGSLSPLYETKSAPLGNRK